MKYNHQLEPSKIYGAFTANIPDGFETVTVAECGKTIPAFKAKFDLLLTTDKRLKKILSPLSFLIPKPKTMFVGTTVSEYSVYPAEIPAHKACDAIKDIFSESKCVLLIAKDIPLNSPLLSANENEFSKNLISKFEEKKFIIVQGEALAFVPVTFASVDEFMQKFSKSRKKDFRRKLKSLSEIAIDEVKTGDDFFTDKIIDELYALFLKVYNDSETHFDLLPLNFFKEVLKDNSLNGIVFIYRREDRIISFNLCFIYNNYLVDKYIGLSYPESHEYNIYFVSWFRNLEYCIKNGLSNYIAGWTDPKIKSYLGADFTYTYHAVYVKNPLLRMFLGKIKRLFEADRKEIESATK